MTAIKTVKEVMSRQFLWVGASTDLQAVSQMMAQRDVGSVLVKSGGQFVGIITETDLVRKVMAKSLSPVQVTAEAVMSYPVATIDAEASLEEAHLKMGEQNIRHLLVTHEGRPVGLISVRTLLESLT
jgi:signal-transduction protein with cAMP-binding, CBS, and nucleotidyltransferase domain